MSVRQARRCALWPGQWAAAVLLAMGVVDVATAQELRLADGRSAVLAGIVAIDPPAPGIRVSLIDPQARSLDRHGRLRGQLRGPDGIWLQAAMVESGLAVVDPATDVAPDTLVELLRLERDARASRRGRWADRSLGPNPAEHVVAAPGAFVLVRGIVREVSRRYDLTYLDFGADWRRDFTVRAATKQLADFARDGLDVAGLVGKRILVRGWLFENAGPMVELAHRLQLEVEE